MSKRGAVSVFLPTFTKPDPNNPGKRVLKTSPNWAYRFEYRNVPHQKGGFKTAALARTAGEKRKSEVTAGLEDDPREFRILGLYELHAARKVQWDETTQKAFEFTWKRLRKKLDGNMRVEMVTATLLLKLVGEWKAEGCSAHTIRTNLSRLREAMRLAHSERRLLWVPEFPKIKTPRREQTVPAVQLSQIAQHMPDRFHLLLEAAMEVGWRARSELQSRRWTDVDLGPSRWLCDCGRTNDGDECLGCPAGRPGWLELDAAASKTDVPRRFPMTKNLRAILTRARERVEAIQRGTSRIIEWVFCEDDGERLGDYQKHWEAALAKLGIGKLPGRKGPWSNRMVMHDVRRTRTRALRNLGLEREVSKALVGHATDHAHGVYLERGVDARTLRAAAVELDRLEQDKKAVPSKVEALVRKG